MKNTGFNNKEFGLFGQIFLCYRCEISIEGFSKNSRIQLQPSFYKKYKSVCVFVGVSVADNIFLHCTEFSHLFCHECSDLFLMLSIFFMILSSTHTRFHIICS